MRLLGLAVAAAFALVAGAEAQTPSPSAIPVATTPPAPTPATTPPGSRLISSIRNKLSAADLLSAESLAEVYRATYGDDGSYLLGISWLARGALLLGQDERARHWIAETRRRTDARIARGVLPSADDSLEIALGAAIEVEAQLRARANGRADAVRFLDAEFARTPGPVALRSRIMKRRNILSLEGRKAPAWIAADHAGAPPPTLESLRGRPVLVYVWDKGCGDCRAFAPTLNQVAARHASAGLAVVPITRFYVKEDHPGEKARLDSTWTRDYPALGATSIVIGDAAMEAYGGSSTPTLAFIDRKGIVRRYTPTRLTEEELEKAIALALR